MRLNKIIEIVQLQPTYTNGITLGICLMQEHHGWTADDWKIEWGDIGSDYRTFITTLREMIKKERMERKQNK